MPAFVVSEIEILDESAAAWRFWLIQASGNVIFSFLTTMPMVLSSGKAWAGFSAQTYV